MSYTEPNAVTEFVISKMIIEIQTVKKMPPSSEVK